MREKMLAMFSAEQLEQREMREVELDDQGVSEAYFPLWGILNVDDYLQKSDAFRLEAARAAEEEARAAAADVDAGSGGAAVGGNGAAIGSESHVQKLRGPRLASAANSSEVAAGAGDGGFGGGSAGASAVGDGGSASDCVAPPVRVAWGIWFWLKRAVVALVVCVVGSLLVTMALNPSMTFFDAAHTLFEGVSGLIEGVFHG